jgi:hypothetical protein
MVPVQHQTDVYFKWSKADFFRDEAQQRADATESAGTGVNVSTASYAAKVWALHQDLGTQIAPTPTRRSTSTSSPPGS